MKASLLARGGIACSHTELNLSVLTAGQSFRWRVLGEGVYRGVISDLVFTLSLTNDLLNYTVHSDSNTAPIQTDARYYESVLRDYLRLDESLSQLYSDWCKRDERFSRLSCDGIRLLRLAPVETLFSFICSSNNNISRITSMVEKLCQQFGQPIAKLDGCVYHSFPLISRLSHSDVEERLRGLDFGYRSRYISQTAQQIINNSSKWFINSDLHTDKLGQDDLHTDKLGQHDLHTDKSGQDDLHSDNVCQCSSTQRSECLCWMRRRSYSECREALMSLSGVGPKVADCICLMSLDKLHVVPVDTHVKQIARNHYKFSLSQSKSLTQQNYKLIGESFEKLWGPKAGWAQAIVFAGAVQKKDQKQTITKTETKTSTTKRTTTIETNTSTTRTTTALKSNKSKRVKREKD